MSFGRRAWRRVRGWRSDYHFGSSAPCLRSTGNRLRFSLSTSELSISGCADMSALAAPQLVSRSISLSDSTSMDIASTAAAAASSSMPPNSVSGGREEGLHPTRDRSSPAVRPVERGTGRTIYLCPYHTLPWAVNGNAALLESIGALGDSA